MLSVTSVAVLLVSAYWNDSIGIQASDTGDKGPLLTMDDEMRLAHSGTASTG